MAALSCECAAWPPTYPVYRDTYHHPDCPWKPECSRRPLTQAEAERAMECAPSVPLSEGRIQEIVAYVVAHSDPTPPAGGANEQEREG